MTWRGAGDCPVREGGDPGRSGPNARYPGLFGAFYDLALRGGAGAGREIMQAFMGLRRGEYRPAVVGVERDGTWRPDPSAAVAETAADGAGAHRGSARPVP